MSLPNDELKGRIIGREGRNIRAFESVTGVNLVVDDTPEMVMVSSFDPVRREIARLALENLVADGRIHPASIEESYEKAQTEVEQSVRDAGEWAVLEAGASQIHPELITLLGRLKYRTSYGQNVLNHLIESAHLAGMLAAELGIDPADVKRSAFLHDIGKAVTHEVQGSHALIGAEIARRFGEDPAVVHGIEAHHNEVEPELCCPSSYRRRHRVRIPSGGPQQHRAILYAPPGKNRVAGAGVQRGGASVRHAGRPGRLG